MLRATAIAAAVALSTMASPVAAARSPDTASTTGLISFGISCIPVAALAGAFYGLMAFRSRLLRRSLEVAAAAVVVAGAALALCSSDGIVVAGVRAVCVCGTGVAVGVLRGARQPCLTMMTWTVPSVMCWS